MGAQDAAVTPRPGFKLAQQWCASGVGIAIDCQRRKLNVRNCWNGGFSFPLDRSLNYKPSANG